MEALRTCDAAVSIGRKMELELPLAGSRPLQMNFADVRGFGVCSRAEVGVKFPSAKAGKPAILLSDSELDSLAEPLRWTLIGKFPKGRPKWVEIQNFFTDLKLVGGFKLANLDLHHFVIHLLNADDYVRVFEKQRWFIHGFSVKILKWSLDFRVDSEPSIVPVWIKLPLVGLHLYNNSMLYSLASIFGKPLRMDFATSHWSRSRFARILVEMDVLGKLESEVWVGNDKCGYLQQVVFENIPSYCSLCRKLGHCISSCFFRPPEFYRRHLECERSSGNVAVDENLQFQLAEEANVDRIKVLRNRFQLEESSASVSLELLSSVRKEGLLPDDVGVHSVAGAHQVDDQVFVCSPLLDSTFSSGGDVVVQHQSVDNLSWDGVREVLSRSAEGVCRVGGQLDVQVDGFQLNVEASSVLPKYDALVGEGIGRGLNLELQHVDLNSASQLSAQDCSVVGVSPLVPVIIDHAFRSKKLNQGEFSSAETMCEQQLDGVESINSPIDLAVSFKVFDASAKSLGEPVDLVFGEVLEGFDGIGFQEHFKRIEVENNDLVLSDQFSLGCQQQVNTQQNSILESQLISCRSDFQQQVVCQSHCDQPIVKDTQDSNLHHSEKSLNIQKDTDSMNVDADVSLDDGMVHKRKGRLIELATGKLNNNIERSMTKRVTRSSLKELGGSQLLLQWNGTEAKRDEVFELIDRVLDDKIRLEELRGKRENAAVLKVEEKKKREDKKAAAVAKVQGKLAGKQKQGRNRGKRK